MTQQAMDLNNDGVVDENDYAILAKQTGHMLEEGNHLAEELLTFSKEAVEATDKQFQSIATEENVAKIKNLMKQALEKTNSTITMTKDNIFDSNKLQDLSSQALDALEKGEDLLLQLKSSPMIQNISLNIVNKLDTNQDGIIDHRDVVGVQSLDVNKDGVIDQRDLQELSTQVLSLDQSKDVIKKLFEDMIQSSVRAKNGLLAFFLGSLLSSLLGGDFVRIGNVGPLMSVSFHSY
jgi:hypothetical protein